MLTPGLFSETSVYDLLTAAAEGRVGADQRWLNAILERGDAAVADMVRFGKEDRSQDPIDLQEEMMVTFRQLGSPEAVPFFVHYLASAPEELPDGVLDALYRFRHEALEPLIELYEKMSEDESGEVAFTLAAFRIPDERVLKILLDRLEYDAGDGALCLGLYGDLAAKPALEKMLSEVDDDHLKRDIADAIGQLGRDMDLEWEPPFDIYEMFPEKAYPETEIIGTGELLEMLDSDDREYRFAAAAGLLNREMSDEAVVKLLEKASRDPEASVRAKCWEALSGEVADSDEVYDAMLARLKDENAPMEERAGALVGLGQRANEPAVRPYAEEFYQNPETRVQAMTAMWNSLDRSFANFFPPHLDDADPEIKKQAISGVGYLSITAASEKLRDFFEDEDLRPNALFAYALSVRTEVTPGRMRPLFRRIEELAGELTEDETELVQMALNERLMLHGHKPVFEMEHEHGPDCDHDHEDDEAVAAPAEPVIPKVGRNDLCPCGSGRKYKKCHGS